MRFATRLIAMMAFAFMMMSGLHADDATNPTAKTRKDKPAASTTVAAGAQPDTAEALLADSPASAQSQSGGDAHPVDVKHSRGESGDYTPRVEWFLGYSFWRAMPTAFSNRIGYLHGGSTSVAYNFNRYFGLVADFAGFNNTRFSSGAGSQTVPANGSVFTYSFGPRLSYRAHERFTPFAQALFGGAHASPVTISGCTGAPSCTPLGSDNALVTMFGAGLDLRISHHLALRLFQGDFLLTHFVNPLSASGQARAWQKNARFSTGIVLRFGGGVPPPPPNRSPTAACSIDKNMVYAGSGDFAVVSANASDPDNDPLGYSWTASGGTVEGDGPRARWNSSGAAEGTYSVKVRVEDGRGGVADCSADILVQARPNRPPVISCSSDRNSVLAGESLQITATASDPDNDPLTYSWESSGGQVRGTGASVNFDTAGVGAGQYSVTGHAADGRGGSADCVLALVVRQLPPPPEIAKLETRLALHSIYFSTARPTAAKPDGGLVGSQEQILATLAEDFKQYLTFRPDAHLILSGHADDRGTEEYNKVLTERRVERTKSFLVDHGVSATAIETRSFGKDDELNAEQITEQIAQNPDLSPDDRKQMLSNLPVMVLANNRRVDISLSTTGQQSNRRYPFNAKDYLALINTRDGETKPPVKKKPRK